MQELAFNMQKLIAACFFEKGRVLRSYLILPFAITQATNDLSMM